MDDEHLAGICQWACHRSLRCLELRGCGEGITDAGLTVLASANALQGLTRLVLLPLGKCSGVAAPSIPIVQGVQGQVCWHCCP